MRPRRGVESERLGRCPDILHAQQLGPIEGAGAATVDPEYPGNQVIGVDPADPAEAGSGELQVHLDGEDAGLRPFLGDGAGLGDVGGRRHHAG